MTNEWLWGDAHTVVCSHIHHWAAIGWSQGLRMSILCCAYPWYTAGFLNTGNSNMIFPAAACHNSLPPPSFTPTHSTRMKWKQRRERRRSLCNRALGLIYCWTPASSSAKMLLCISRCQFKHFDKPLGVGVWGRLVEQRFSLCLVV